MNSFTHIGISGIIKHVVESELEIKLDGLGFTFGNIKPDISSYMFTIPHYKNTASRFIKNEIGKIMDIKINKYTKCSRKFSERLGIITHYLSDFFCYAHNDMFKGNLLQHYVYERHLSFYCKNNEASLKNCVYTRQMRSVINLENVWEYIEKLHSIYLSKSPSFSNDISFALRACITTVILVLSSCMAEVMETAA